MRTCRLEPRYSLIGFQRRLWEAKIAESLDKRPNKKGEYVFLRSQQVRGYVYPNFYLRLIIDHQLVGTALLILVKAELTAVIRNVEAATHKVSVTPVLWGCFLSPYFIRLVCVEYQETRVRWRFASIIMTPISASSRPTLPLAIVMWMSVTRTTTQLPTVCTS